MKELLLELVAEIEDLRANLVALGHSAENQPASFDDAQAARNAAKQNYKKHYDEIRSRIEKLP